MTHSEYNVQVSAQDIEAGAPRTVPCAFLEPLRDRIYKVHGQTLERLSNRGGLSPLELFCHFDAASLPEEQHFRNFWLCLDSIRVHRFRPNQKADRFGKWLGETLDHWRSAPRLNP